MLALGVFIWFVFFKPLTFNIDDVFFANSTGMPTNNSIDSLDINIIKPTEESEQILVIDTLPVSIDSALAIVEEPEKESMVRLNDTYLVLIGSFGKLSNAQKMVKRAEAKNIPAKIKKIGRLHRVIIFSSNSEKEAKLNEQIHQNTFNEKPFVLVQ